MGDLIMIALVLILSAFMVAGGIAHAIRERKTLNGEETARIQEMFRGFERFEKRVQANETILLDRVERR